MAIALASHGPIQIGQVAVALGLFEEHHVLAGEHVNPDALYDDLDQRVCHDPIIPLPGSGRPDVPGRAMSRCWARPAVRLAVRPS